MSREHKIIAPTDMLGNEITKDMVVYAQPKFPILYKVVKVDWGGLMTPQGSTPALVTLVTDFVLAQPPGSRFANLVKVAFPLPESALTSISDLLGKA